MGARGHLRRAAAVRPPQSPSRAGRLAGPLLLAAVVAGGAQLVCSDDETAPAPVATGGSGGVGTGGSTGGTGGSGGSPPDADEQGTLWRPYLEWTFDNDSYEGNPFDVVATVTFTHADGDTHETEMFYQGSDVWAVRFTGTRGGLWSWQSTSDDPELDRHSGTVWMDPNPDVNGFVTAAGDKWVMSGTERAFVPQYAMFGPPDAFYDQPSLIADEIERLMVQHGFSGVHVPVMCRWAELDQERCDMVADSDPDLRTFEALELLITEVHAAGGAVHLWAWGDDSRNQTPTDWTGGLNGPEDQRMQRYIAARLGPLPGWTMGYGFDLDEWVVEQDLTTWHAFMADHFGWPHLLGGRAEGPNSGLDHSAEQISEQLDYSGYEHHQPSYDVYVAAIEARPTKPTFSEDRFRVRTLYAKDYDEPMTRRGLYHSAMAGGVANIWGHLLDTGAGGDPTIGLTNSYDNPEWIRTYATFFEQRFFADFERCSELTVGAAVCLKRPDDAHFVFYAEDASSITLDLSSMPSEQPAIAVDALLEYAEIDLGSLSSQSQLWAAPYDSDWVIAVGDFQ